MKKLLFLFVFLAGSAEARQIVLDIPDGDIRIVEEDVLNAETWIKDAWKGKLSKCKSRIVNKEINLSIKNGETLPAGEDAIVQKYLARPESKTRTESEKK